MDSTLPASRAAEPCCDPSASRQSGAATSRYWPMGDDAFVMQNDGLGYGLRRVSVDASAVHKIARQLGPEWAAANPALREHVIHDGLDFSIEGVPV